MFNRQLDAVFAMHVFGWKFEQSSTRKYVEFFRPDKYGFVKDELPFYRDNSNLVIMGIEKLRDENILISLHPVKDAFVAKVSGKICNIYVKDKSANLAIMCAALLAKGLEHDVIQGLIDNQFDWTSRIWEIINREREWQAL